MTHLRVHRYGNKEIESRVSYSLPAGVQCEKGYTPPPRGTASRSRRSCKASSLRPQTASWCCLSSWHESACRERERKRKGRQHNYPPLFAYITASFANGSARFMRQSCKAHLADDMTVSLELMRFNHQQSLLAPTGR